MSADTEQPVEFKTKCYLNIDIVMKVDFTMPMSDASDDDRENEFVHLATEAAVKRLNFDTDDGVEYVVRTAEFEDAD